MRLQLGIRPWDNEERLAATTEGGYLLRVRRSDHPAIFFPFTAAVAAWSTLFGFIAMLLFAGWEVWNAPPRLTAQAIGVAAYLVVVVTVAGLFLWLHLLRTVPARVAASVKYLQAVVGIEVVEALVRRRGELAICSPEPHKYVQDCL